MRTKRAILLKKIYSSAFQKEINSNRNDPNNNVPVIRKTNQHLDAVDQNEETFKKVLIANRGEIACRIIKTAKKMGIKTVAVYSIADAQAKHIKLADERVFLGPSPAIDSYLNINKLMEIVKETNVDAVHPGYGFLSENAEFAKLVESENVTFIGPTAETIRKMGDKLESKRTAMAAGVNIIPGYNAIVTDVDHCIEIARHIGYPVMIKASAGGGGKGMRVARNDQEAKEGFNLSTQEAKSSFGDGRMLIEKYIENPRHIEVQVLADQHGNVIHLNERECSIQRRNQKVIEEAPSIFLDNETRTAIGNQSIALCKQLNYSSVGTVEFLIDHYRNFYFLEMNTRLQVEHPVTEQITGIDLVQQMFRVAKGHRLNIKQNDIGINGWAIESRIYAEDPYKSFGLPSTGRLHKYKEPNNLLGLRYDSGVEEGSRISMYYDSLICKLICHGTTRTEAIEKTIKTLDSYIIRGITHNIPLLRDIVSQEKFQQGNITTNYLTEVYPDGFKGFHLDETNRYKLISAAAAIFATNELRNRSFINIPDFKIRGKTLEKWELFIKFDGNDFFVNVFQTNGKFRIEINSEIFFINKNDIDLAWPIMVLKINGEKHVFQSISRNPNGDYQMTFFGNFYKLKIMTKKAVKYLDLMPKQHNNSKSNQIKSPMSGLVKSVFCNVGDFVTEGQELCVLEAMKMQNLMVAPSNAKIKSININVGDKVKDEDILIELDLINY